jgi:hypothetical protein
VRQSWLTSFSRARYLLAAPAAAGLALFGVVATGGQASAASGDCTGTTVVTCTFTYTGAAQTWTVPTGVTVAQFTVYGAKGGGDTENDSAVGVGAKVTGALPVTPGTSLQVNVGQAGTSNGSGGTGSAFGGGGDGGADGGGGGGASDIRDGSYALADRLLVAGGGGGGADHGLTENYPFPAGGGGGNADSSGGTGQSTAGACGEQLSGGGGGGAGTTSAGGAAGAAGAASGCGGATADGGVAGKLGAGGAGGTEVGGGGGGGGYYGGGGGGGQPIDNQGYSPGAGGGGGGASYTGSATNASVSDGVAAPDDSPNGEVIISYPVEVTATVTGSQTFGSTAPAFQNSLAPSGVAVSGTATCTTVNGGTPISATMAAGSYTIDGASCSGLTAPPGYAVSYAGGTFTVGQAAQAITFTAPASGTVGGTATLTATGGDSGNPVTFTIDPSSGAGVCTVTGNTVTYDSVGSCVIDADQAGTANYAKAPTVTGTIPIQVPTIAVTVTGSQTYGSSAPTFTPAYTAPPGVTVSGTVTCTTVSGGAPISAALGPYTYTIDGPSCTGLTATGGYNLTYTGTFTVSFAPQAITFTAPASGTVGGTATLTATGGDSGHPVTFTIDPTSGNGVCTVSGDTVTYTGAGSCVIDADQAGDNDYAKAPTVTRTIPVQAAATHPPAFTADTPPLSAATGTGYSYQFTAAGTPAPSFTLGGGAPSWLTINPTTGTVTGTPPNGTKSFRYSVTATNSAGTVTAGPFTVSVSDKADLSLTLWCPAALTVGGSGACTLTVTNRGPARATDVAVGAAVPDTLKVTGCSAGCWRFGGLLGWSAGSLAAGQSDTLSFTITATRGGTALIAAADGSANLDPNPFNNLAFATTKIAR